MKRQLADVLWKAANVHLWTGGGADRRGEEFSCHAVLEAVDPGVWFNRSAISFLSALGRNPGEASDFDRFKDGRRRQGVRYMWLLLAACVAEDEGITV